MKTASNKESCPKPIKINATAFLKLGGIRMVKKIRLGLLGLGPRMRILLPVYLAHEGVEIVAVCDKYRRNMDVAVSEVKEIGAVGFYLVSDQ